MTMPFYVSPEQLMKDRADYARKGIGRGRSVAVVQYADGILFVSENPSQALHKISEIYDRIGFAAVGRYNEFENLRIAGVRLADLRGYSYDRRDVTGRGLANAYAQTLGSIFSSGGEKPYEVELFVAELGESSATDQVFRLTYDGQVADEQGFAAMGGQAESVTAYLSERWRDGLSLTDALRLAVAALGHGDGGEDRTIPPADLEVAVLDRTRTQQRKFRRIGDALLAGMLDGPPPAPPEGPADDGPGESGPGESGGGDDAADGAEAPGDGPITPAAVTAAPGSLAGPDDVDPAVDEPLDVSGEEPVEEPQTEPVDEPAPESTAFDAETADPAEVASAESALSELDIEQETPADEAPGDEAPADEAPADEAPAEEAPAEEAPADEAPAEPSPVSEEEWPPVAPPLPPSAVDGPAERSGETPDPTPGEPVTPWGDEPDDPPTQVLSSDDDPVPPRADRPPPPAPVEPVGDYGVDSGVDAGDGPEATEDLEREWSPEGDGGSSFFDLYGDTAAGESSPTEPDQRPEVREDGERTEEPEAAAEPEAEEDDGADDGAGDGSEEHRGDHRY